MKYPCLLTIAIFCFRSHAQVGGSGTYAFLNLNPSARSLSMGSNMISAIDRDLSVAWQNPAAINPLMHNSVFVSYNNYVSDINSGYFSYGKDFRKKGTFVASIMYLDYGKFPGFTVGGISTGIFAVKDQCFQIGYGTGFREKFRLGASLKYVYSIYESYVSNGIAGDLSAIYNDTANRFTVTAFANNIGFQLVPYGEAKREPLPFQMALTLAKRLKHLPFSYNIVFHDLQKPDMRYSYETDEKDENGKAKVRKMMMGDNIVRHITIGGELNITKHFVIRFGYNHMRRKEVSPEQKRGTTGFSWGLSFRISKFHIGYGSASIFPGYNSNQFSLQCNLSEFYSKKAKKS